MRAIARLGRQVSQRELAQKKASSSLGPIDPFAIYRGIRFFSTRIESRVNDYAGAEVGKLGKKAVSLDSVDLADQCCRFRDFVGMRLAHVVLEKTIAEKRYHDKKCLNQEQEPFPLPILLFQKIMYGWACLAKKGAVAQVRMRELMDLLIQIAVEEETTLKNHFGNNSHGQLKKLQPTIDVYNTYLTGLRNAAELSPKAATAARDVLEEMIKMQQLYGWHTKPNTKSYTFVIKAFANSGLKNAGIEAEKVLRAMQQVHLVEKEEYFSETGKPYNTEDPTANKRRIVTPDEIVYSYAIQAYAQDPSPKSVAKARDLLIEVIGVQDGTVKPNFALFTGTIDAYARLAQNVRISKEMRYNAAQQAEEILEILLGDMTSLKADNVTSRKRVSSLVAPFNGET